MSEVERYKRQAAHAALARVRSGMRVGLGSGSTAEHMVRELGRRLAAGELSDVRGVPTSRAIERLAQQVGVPLIELGAEGVDVAIDGMDEVDPALDAIKGLGGALTREKIVAAAAHEFVLIGDIGKKVGRLGERTPVPVEVLAFGWRRTLAHLRDLGADPHLRVHDGAPWGTDNGHLVVDCHLPAHLAADALRAFAAAVDQVPGVLGHGLFLGITARAYLAGPEGVEELLPPR
ncbi:MAG: ribose-5-phosphate isomerase RpiA [bacterium]|nr:ribose-5-phosphate isomerase RpiA [bacterium]